MAQTLLHNKSRVLGGDVSALKLNRTLAGVNDAGDGFEDGGFAGTVRPQHGGNFAAPDLQADAPNGLDWPVSAFDIEQLQYRRIAYGGRAVAHVVCLRNEETSSTEPR